MASARGSIDNALGGTSNEGIVRNSALSFVPTSQPGNIPRENEQAPGIRALPNPGPSEPINLERLVPPGLKALYDVCSALYPDQSNPLQVTTRLKYWLGGSDPLDYISMYWNPGIPEENIPPHWHYISFGLSDLHGDGRVHPLGGAMSGRGVELTWRVRAGGGGGAGGGGPPLWPPALLQALAGYVMNTGNTLLPGDHISWHSAIDGASSKLRHLLVTEDPKLPTVNTPHGTVTFLQLVGCTGRELRAAQRTSGFEVLKHIAEDPECGGSWLITDTSRARSAARVCTRFDAGRAADLAGVSTVLHWREWRASTENLQQSECISATLEQQIKETLQRGLSNMSTDRSVNREGHNMSTDSFEMSSIERALPDVPELMRNSHQSLPVEYLDGVHITFNAEGASLLQLAVDGRVRHGSWFTFRTGAHAVTLCGGQSTAVAAVGDQLQVIISDDLAKDMSKKFSNLSRLAESDSESDEEGDGEAKPVLPLTLTWPKHGIKISVVENIVL